MAYSVSNQRRRLETQIDEIVKKLRLGAKKGVPVELREFAIAAGVFLAHAEIENFFIDVLDGVAKALSFTSVEPSALSSKLRAHLIYERFGLSHITTKVVGKGGEQEVFSAMEKWLISPHLSLVTGSGSMEALTGADIYGDYSYPSIKNIERVLRRLGIGDPRGSLNSIGKRDVIGILESVASLRTALAHSAVLPGINLGDIIRNLNNLKIFVRAFDRLLYSHTRKSVSHIIWLNSLC